MNVGCSPALTRRSVIGSALLAAAGGLSGRGRTGRPNILFVMADDLGWADLSCTGRRDYRTPVIDRLAADGLLLSQAYASSPVCSPTRVALVTGRYPQRLHVGLAEPIRTAKLDPESLPPAQGLLPRMLRAAGYSTSLIGKWHMGWPPAAGPLACGYDRFFGIAAGGSDYFSHREPDLEQPDKGGLSEGDRRIARDGYLTDLLADQAVAEIRAAGPRPFFISLHFTAPHWPWQGPRDAATSASIGDLRHEDGGSLETFAAMVQSMDAGLGRVLAELDRAGRAEDTLVVFTSDNGGERFSDTWPLRGGKGELLEGGIRVPAILRWPSRIAAGSRSAQVMATIDWLPTLAAAAGAKIDSAFPPDGENLLAVFTGAVAPRARRLRWRFAARDQAAIRDGDFKYLRIGGEEHLYDVTADPRERVELKRRRPDVFARLKSDFARWDAAMLRYPDKPRVRSASG